MAMNFMAANRAETPPIYDATIRQAQIANQLRQAEQQRRMMYGMGGAQLAEQVPYSKWADFGNALIGAEGAAGAAGAATATDAALASSVVDPLTGAVASGIPEAAGAAELLGAGAASSAAPTAALGAEAAGTAAGAMGAAGTGAGAAGAAGGGAGAGASLAALGPLGWAALLGFGLMATDAL